MVENDGAERLALIYSTATMLESAGRSAVCGRRLLGLCMHTRLACRAAGRTQQEHWR